MIIDLSEFNKCVRKVSFRMEGIDTIKKMLKEDDYMVSIDLSNAFFTIPLHAKSKPFTTFEFNGQRYCYNVLPFGLTCSPRIFSKMLRPCIIWLRNKGVRLTAYLDDIFICASSVEVLNRHCSLTLELLSSLGFPPNYAKSVLVPSQSLLHLGYLWDSTRMSLSLPSQKILKTKVFASQLLSSQLFTLRKLSSFIGLLVSHSNAFSYAPIHYRTLQLFFNTLLQTHNWEDLVSLPSDALEEVIWWSNCPLNLDPILINDKKVSFTIHTDASSSGWGSWSSSNQEAFGSWSDKEQSFHINYLELLAIWFSLNCFVSQIKNKCVHIVTDNISAMFYVKKMGGTHSSQMCKLAIKIWKFCIVHNTWLRTSYIPSLDNCLADSLSRLEMDRHDYELCPQVFLDLTQTMCLSLDIDLFASRLTHKLPKYVSRSLDPFAHKTDAFSFPWKGCVYLFPPIPIISRVIQKFIHDQVEIGLLILPFWPGLPDIPSLIDLLIDNPVLLPASSR